MNRGRLLRIQIVHHPRDSEDSSTQIRACASEADQGTGHDKHYHMIRRKEADRQNLPCHRLYTSRTPVNHLCIHSKISISPYLLALCVGIFSGDSWDRWPKLRHMGTRDGGHWLYFEVSQPGDREWPIRRWNKLPFLSRLLRRLLRSPASLPMSFSFLEKSQELSELS